MEAHILVVDDDQAIRDLIGDYLIEHDFKVSMAESGADMDRVLGAEVVDLVILDLKLPDEDGLAIARRLRESHDLPIIIVTGRKEEVGGSTLRLEIPPIFSTSVVWSGRAKTLWWNAGTNGAPWPPAATSRLRKSATTLTPVSSAKSAGLLSWLV